MTRLHAVIMAGGGGTRLWPVSRRGRPKQLLRLAGDRSLFAESVARLTPWLPAERITVAASAELCEVLAPEAPTLPRSSFLIEPEPKGTAAVLGLAAVVLAERDPDAVMAVLTSDHAIAHPERLRVLLEAGAELAAGGAIVTLGIPPESPDTGYGYLRRGPAVPGATEAYEVLEFREKPDRATAERYLADGEHFWNSGMFLWRPARLLAEIDRQMPALARVLTLAARPGGAESDAFRAAWAGLVPETIDYGIMEHAEGVVVLPAEGLGWSDIGTWDRVYDLLAKDASGNVVLQAAAMFHESSGNLVVGGGDISGRLIVLEGVRDIVLVDTGDVVLVCHREHAGAVRAVVEALERGGLGRYLH